MIHQENLLSVKDDMVAFIEGHGMRRLPGFVGEEVPTVLWEDSGNPDSWKDFVETAKAAGAPFVTMSEVVLEKEDLEMLLEEMQAEHFPDEEVPDLVHVISKILSASDPDDGVLWNSPVHILERVRTGEHGLDAV